MLGNIIRTEPFKFREKLLGPLLLVVGIFYLLFHVLSGERGVYALLKEQRKLDVLQAQLTQITAQRQALEKRVKLLSSDSLDLDLLDEESREVLGTAGKDEVMIPLNKSDR